MGQSEIEVDNVVDFVVNVMQPGAGDELQALKKGTTEIADMIVINKYDSDYKRQCEYLKEKLSNLHCIASPKHPEINWQVPIELVSTLGNFNVESIWAKA